MLFAEIVCSSPHCNGGYTRIIKVEVLQGRQRPDGRIIELVREKTVTDEANRVDVQGRQEGRAAKAAPAEEAVVEEAPAEEEPSKRSRPKTQRSRRARKPRPPKRSPRPKPKTRPTTPLVKL